MFDIKKLDTVDNAILFAFYCSWNHIQPFPPILPVRYIGDMILMREIGEKRSGAAVHERIDSKLIPAGLMVRNDNGTASPFHISIEGMKYVERIYAERLGNHEFAGYPGGSPEALAGSPEQA